MPSRLLRALSVLGMTLLMSALLTAQPATAEQSRSAVILAHGGAGSGTDQPGDPMSGMDMGGTGSSGSMPGMDMGGTGSSAPTSGMKLGTAQSSDPMSGMDMGGTGSSGSMPGMNMPGPGGTSTGGASSHPRGLLFGGFAVVNVTVLLAAARLRRLRRRGKTTRPRRAVTSG
jgi:hypothetical protein